MSTCGVATRVAWRLAMAAAVVGIVCCGSGSGGSVAVRVGKSVITSRTVARRTAAITGGRAASNGSKRQKQREQALSLLISSQWLLGEAARDGIRLSATEVSSQLARRTRSSFPGGTSELREYLKATGQSMEDVLTEARAELAAIRIRKMLEQREPPITRRQIVGYYSRHREQFVIPEQVEADLIALDSRTEAEALRRRVVLGKQRLSSVAERQSFELPALAYSPTRGKDAILAKAIHSARPHVLTGPVRFRGYDYYLFEILKVKSARQQTLAQVEGRIKHRLAVDQQERTLAGFIAAWRDRWMARTSCSPGYVVQKCRQYAGQRSRENPLAFD
jgi:hypothetical protein